MCLQSYTCRPNLTGLWTSGWLRAARHDCSVTIRVLSFDADQTLWDFHGVYRLALDATVAAIVDRGILPAAAVSADALRLVRDEVVEGVRGRPHSLEEVRERSFSVFLDRAGHATPAETAAELIELYLQVRFDSIKLYPDVRGSLQRLGMQYQLGLVTNGNTYPERCGLPGVFAAQVIGPEHGFEKPDPRAFERLAQQLSIEPAEMLHVGDDHDDIAGANGVGAVSVYINRTGSRPPWANDADYEITDLVGLEQLLRERSGRDR